MKPGKTIFLGVGDAVAAICKPEGFVDHPIYPTGWEPANQCYQRSLIRSDISRHIDQLECSYYPVDRAFRFHVNRCENLFGLGSIADLPDSAGDWTDMWLHKPFDEYLLCSGSAWNPFSIRVAFPLGKRDMLDVDVAVRKITTGFGKNAKYLLDALSGDYQGRLVDVSRYNLAQSG